MVKVLPSNIMEVPQAKRMQVVEDDEHTLTPEVSPKYSNYLCCFNCMICCATLGTYPCPLISSGRIARNTTVRLTSEAVEHQDATSDCCCNLSKRKANIPLETITDVSITTSCCLSLFGLKQLDVTTLGSPYSEARICQLKDPEGFRAAILEARKRRKDKEMMVVVKKQNDPITKIKEAKELFEMGILSQGEYEEIRKIVMDTDEFKEEKKKLMESFLKS